MPNQKHTSLVADVYLFAFLGCFSLGAVLMGLSGQILLNTIFLGITVVLILITYFLGLLTGLLANLAFIFVQIVIMIYLNGAHHSVIPWQLAFWLVLPILLSWTFDGMTRQLRQLQSTNAQLQSALVQRGAFDAQTNLRTTRAYIEDAQVFIETNRRFELPVSTVIIRIRYYHEIRRMMSNDQLQALLQLASDTLKQSTRSNDITYLLDNDNPTWAILLFTNEQGATIAANRLRKTFDDRLKQASDLNEMAISLVVGVAAWDAATMHGPYDLMNAGIKETEYDV